MEVFEICVSQKTGRAAGVIPMTRHDHGREPISPVNILVASALVNPCGYDFIAENCAT